MLAMACVSVLTRSATAQMSGPTSSSPVACSAFKKNPNGSWTATRDVTVTIGSLHVNAGANTTYALNAIYINGFDFAAYLDAHCATVKK